MAALERPWPSTLARLHVDAERRQGTPHQQQREAEPELHGDAARSVAKLGASAAVLARSCGCRARIEPKVLA